MARALTARRPRLGTLALIAAGLSLAAIFAFWAWGRLGPAPVVPARVSGARAEVIVRQTEVAFADAQAVWRRHLKAAGHAYAPATLTFFTDGTGSPCAGGTVAGPFYCPETGTAAFDLGWLDALGPRLNSAEEVALSLVAARIAAEHLQRELGILDSAALRLPGTRRGERATIATTLALQADCFTGVWAAAAEPRIGKVPPDLYDRLVWSARNVSDERDRAAAGFDAFGLGRRPDRERAFAQGYAAGELSGCPMPAELSGAG